MLKRTSIRPPIMTLLMTIGSDRRISRLRARTRPADEQPMFRLIVNNLSDGARAPDLLRLFGGYGKVRRIALAGGTGSRYALVHMSSEKEGLTAEAATDGRPLLGRLVRVVACFASSEQTTWRN
jgi:RNA recognition motif-containing protein